MPAQWLERRVPAMKNKGRIRQGADADIVVFNANRIIDRATFQQLTLPSDGVVHALVNGVIVVRGGIIQEGVYPGEPVRAAVQAEPKQE
jgi:N-acyl-D-aspartate/D-glutamate deacylase